MSDDSFIREVDEEIRNDQFKDFWSKYKWLIIGAAVAMIGVTAGYRIWDYQATEAAGKSGDRFIEAVQLSNEGNHAEAIEVLQKLGEDGVGEYPALASIRLAAEYAKQGDIDKAVEAFDSIAGDNTFNETLRNVARLRAGLLLVDHGSYEEVTIRLQTMANTGQSFRHSSREGLGLSAWKHNKYEDAHRWFTAVAEDAEAPGGIRQRATIMLELLAGKGVKGATAS